MCGKRGGDGISRELARDRVGLVGDGGGRGLVDGGWWWLVVLGGEWWFGESDEWWRKRWGENGEMISRSFGMFGKCDGRAGEIKGRFGGGWALVWSRTEMEVCERWVRSVDERE